MLENLKSTAHHIVAERHVRRVVAQCSRLLSEPAQANSVPIAHAINEKISDFDAVAYRLFFNALAQRFNPSPDAVLRAANAYADAPSAQTMVALSKAAEPPRQELFRRLNRAPEGTRALVKLRRRLLHEIHQNPSWQSIEFDLLHLLSSWFNPGFLQMRKVDWNSRAHILEQIIQHEAVHTIDGWDDLRRRLQPDRRCFAFFHPQLGETPLIFVEVALLPEMPAEIAPLIDKRAEILAPNKFKVAVFYSISNCEPGLRGVSLGNFLIKHVAKALKSELPQLKSFCTLSPIPSLRHWLATQAPEDRDPKVRQALDELGEIDAVRDVSQFSPNRRAALAQLASVYLSRDTQLDGGDPVARFHLENGARLERINVAANLSAAGTKQSMGTMVNYLYDLEKVESQREAFVGGKVSVSRSVSRAI